MTALAHERTQLLNQYMAKTQGKVIDPYGPNAPSAVALAHDYLQFLVGHPLPAITGDAYQWAGKEAGRVLANIPAHEVRTTAKPEPWADFTPAPTTTGRKHRAELTPIPGDLIVFDKNPRQGNPWGTLGIYLDHETSQEETWTVYTQGFGPPAVLTIDAEYLRPIGWWRVTDHRLRARAA